MAVAAIILMAFLLRAGLAIVHPMFFPDSRDYNALAHTILAGTTYEVRGLFASRLPGYPVYIATIEYLFGPARMAVLLSQAVCGSLTVLLVFLIARRINHRVAIIAALLAAVDPLSVAFSAALLSEIPFTLILMFSLWLCVRIMENPRPSGPWVLLGLSWGVATYLRGEAILLIFPLIGWVGWTCLQDRTIARPLGIYLRMMLALLLAVACLMPWWIRNYRLFGQDFFRMSTLQGISLYEAVYPQATGGPRQSAIRPPPAIKNLNESQRDLAWTRRAWHWVLADPLRIAWLAVVKIGRTWSPWLHARHFRAWWINVPLVLWTIPQFLLALRGLMAGRRIVIPTGILGMLLLTILYFTMMHALFIGSVRYRVELLPLVDLLAATGLVRLVAWPRPQPAHQRDALSSDPWR
jgi:4-amino-4-deoxy-L-arabinose transferase-like glycosyltransferase